MSLPRSLRPACRGERRLRLRIRDHESGSLVKMAGSILRGASGPPGSRERAALRNSGQAGIRGPRPALHVRVTGRSAQGSLSRSRLFGSASIFVVAIFLIGCAGRQPAANRQPAPPVQPAPAPPAETAKSDASVPPMIPIPRAGVVFEQGKASWYGAPFHGRHASNGEIYDMNKLTAAHRTLPFNTVVRVTNETNGKSTTGRITAPGPFGDNRIIDLSNARAREADWM